MFKIKHILAIFISSLFVLSTTSLFAIDLTGTYTAKSGSKVYIKQVNDEIFYYSDVRSASYGIIIGFGRIKEKEIQLIWTDMQKTGNPSSGVIVFDVVSDKKLVLKHQTGIYSEQELLR